MKINHIFILVAFLAIPVFSSAQIFGCTDPLANNYNPDATINNGSCTYNAVSVTPVESFNLAATLLETSGLIRWDDQVWTHNDNDDINLYALDTLSGSLMQTQPLPGVENIDWEEISQDEEFVYVGDFGNNLNGNRTDLKILKINKVSLLSGAPSIEIINFSYSNQVNFEPTGANNTDFDCEALIVSADSIFLFAKQWISHKTSVYSLSKIPGTHIANLSKTYDIQGLITGSVYLESKDLIVLCGYSSLVQPFIYLLYDFAGNNFFSGNKRKIDVSLPFHQVEGIATIEGLKYYISNENFSQPPINIPQKLHILDLTDFLENYLGTINTTGKDDMKSNFEIFPVPARCFITIRTGKEQLPLHYIVTNLAGDIVLSGMINSNNHFINISVLSNGLYLFYLGNNRSKSFLVMNE